MLIRAMTWMTLALVVAANASTAMAQHDHDHGHGDIIVGLTGPTAPQADRLAFEADLDHAVLLSPVSGLLEGWTSTNPGFGALSADEVDELFFVLGQGAQVRLEIVSIDAGFSVVQAGGGAIADAVGESVLLGGASLHSHVTWYARGDTLGDDWLGSLGATFRLIDVGTTGYAPSETFAMTFTNVPEPASLVLLGVGAVMVGAGRGRTMRLKPHGLDPE